MSILWWIIVGFIAGMIAKFIMPGDNEPRGFIMTTILGIVGAVIAGFIGNALHIGGPDNWLMDIVSAVIGAIILLVIWGVISRNSARRI